MSPEDVFIYGKVLVTIYQYLIHISVDLGETLRVSFIIWQSYIPITLKAYFVKKRVQNINIKSKTTCDFLSNIYNILSVLAFLKER